MNTSPKLIIKLDEDDEAAFNAALPFVLGPHWNHSTELLSLGDGSFVWCFRRKHPGQIVRVYVLRLDSETLSVVSIVPLDKRLTSAQHEQVLADFRHSILDKLVAFGLPITIQQRQAVPIAPVDPPLRPKILRTFRRFCAYRKTPPHCLQPFNIFDWQWLLAALHATGQLSNFDQLRQWFRLDETFPPAGIALLERDFALAFHVLQRHGEILAWRAGKHPLSPKHLKPEVSK